MRRTRISSTELARSIGDILGRVRYRGETFVIERNGKDVALLSPEPAPVVRHLRDVLHAWLDAGPPDLEWAEILERVGQEDRPPEDPWGSSSTRAP